MTQEMKSVIIGCWRMSESFDLISLELGIDVIEVKKVLYEYFKN